MINNFFLWDCGNYSRTEDFKKVLNKNQIEYWENSKNNTLLLNIDDIYIYIDNLKDNIEKINQILKNSDNQKLTSKKYELLELINEVDDFIIDCVKI